MYTYSKNENSIVIDQAKSNDSTTKVKMLKMDIIQQYKEGINEGAKSNITKVNQLMTKNSLKTQTNLHVVQRKPNNTGLPDNLKTNMEDYTGISLDDVQVHYNSDKPSNLQALAYTQGNEIYVGSGQEKHLPHEAWHVVQQKQGRVNATTSLNGNDINDDVSLESEADYLGNILK